MNVKIQTDDLIDVMGLGFGRDVRLFIDAVAIQAWPQALEYAKRFNRYSPPTFQVPVDLLDKFAASLTENQESRVLLMMLWRQWMPPMIIKTITSIMEKTK